MRGLEGLQHLLGKALGIGGQGLRRYHPRNLPVANGGVLSHRGLRQPGHRPSGAWLPTQKGQPLDVSQSGPPQIGNMQLPGPGAGPEGIHPHIPRNRSESGIAPAPQESSTIRKIRFRPTFPPSQIHMAPRSGSPPNPGSNQLFLHLHCHFQRHLHHVRKGVLPFCGSSLLPGEDVVGNGANAQGPLAISGGIHI